MKTLTSSTTWDNHCSWPMRNKSFPATGALGRRGSPGNLCIFPNPKQFQSVFSAACYKTSTNCLSDLNIVPEVLDFSGGQEQYCGQRLKGKIIILYFL
jgi:hypothetical protein